MKLGNWILMVALICAGHCVYAAEVYTWKDQNGITHFSQVPPEAGDSKLIDVEDASPSASDDAYQGSAQADAAITAETEDMFTESGEEIAQQRLDQIATDRKTRKEERIEMAKLCQKNEELLARLEPARRVVYTNDQGEQVRLDDTQRMGLISETKAFVDKNCK